ncbi:MAG TPA: NAD(P)H-dependent oxidoreductase [Rhizomicrobium sp.]|jgi:FMN-dependent NADH-azoreductase|nr:NAD(P)H-dependent oxidoreductase [Rhizomicrobium sp.]
MKNLLFVTSSLSGRDSKSAQIGEKFVDIWQASHGPVRVTKRDLGRGTIPHLTGDHLKAWTTAPDDRPERETALAQESNPLPDEVEAADVIVVAVPMYNFAIPSTLKAWVDHITRAGRTFRYTSAGTVEGLLKNKKVFVVAARGGIYTGDSPGKALDFQEPYLRAILGFNGLTDVTFIHVESQKTGPEAADAGLAHAHKCVSTVAAPTGAAA